MKTILIITEDIVKIQTLTGFFGKMFSFIYLTWLNIHLKFLVFFLKPFFKITLVTSDYFKINQVQTIYYGQLLSKVNYSKNRQLYLDIVDDLLKDVKNTQAFKTKLTIYLTFHYFIYAEIYQQLIKELKPNKVITLSNSYHEQTARFMAQQNNLKTIKLHFFTLIKLNHWLKRFFLNREHHQKITNFINHSKLNPPSTKNLKQATFLGLDFFRHLKTLGPIYQELQRQKKNPWLVTDITNLNQSLANLNLSHANHLYLASFSKKPITQKTLKSLYTKANLSIKNLPQPQIQDLQSYLLNLSRVTTKPMIKHSLVLSDLYLSAAQQLYKLAQPKGLVVVSDIRFNELALSYLAKQKQVNSLLVSPNTLLSLDELNSYLSTNKVAVVGKFIKQKLINQGLSSNTIHIVGDPRIENYHQLELDRTKVYKALKINSDKKIILLISFRSTWMIPKSEKKAFFKLASKSVTDLANTVLVIKPHPTEKRYRVQEELKEWGITNVVISDNNQLELIDLLNASSVILQTWSMTIFEAIMMNRPVISINPHQKDYNNFLPVLGLGGAKEVNSLQELKRWLTFFKNPNHPKTKLQLKKAKTACSQFIKPPDGQVASRIIKLLSI